MARCYESQTPQEANSLFMDDDAPPLDGTICFIPVKVIEGTGYS